MTIYVKIKYNGVKSVSRYKRIDYTSPEPAFIKGKKGTPKYLTIFEFRSKEASAAFERSLEHAASLAETKETWGDKQPDAKFILKSES